MFVGRTVFEVMLQVPLAAIAVTKNFPPHGKMNAHGTQKTALHEKQLANPSSSPDREFAVVSVLVEVKGPNHTACSSSILSF
jgi:hypothetical protein